MDPPIEIKRVFLLKVFSNFIVVTQSLSICINHPEIGCTITYKSSTQLQHYLARLGAKNIESSDFSQNSTFFYFNRLLEL